MNNIRFLTYSLLEVSYYFIVRKIGLYQPSVTYLPLALADLGSSGIHTFLWYFPLFSLLFDQLRLWLRKYVPAIGTRNTVFKYSQKKLIQYCKDRVKRDPSWSRVEFFKPCDRNKIFKKKRNVNYLSGYEQLLSSFLFVLSLGSPWLDFYLTWPFQIKSWYTFMRKDKVSFLRWISVQEETILSKN